VRAFGTRLHCSLDYFLGGAFPRMHDVLVALGFFAMVACPAICAMIPRHEAEDES
jgi:hypothetical protein